MFDAYLYRFYVLSRRRARTSAPGGGRIRWRACGGISGLVKVVGWFLVQTRLDAREFIGVEQTFLDHLLIMVDLIQRRGGDVFFKVFLPPTLDPNDEPVTERQRANQQSHGQTIFPFESPPALADQNAACLEGMRHPHRTDQRREKEIVASG
jgi:hypothetical protein